MQQNEVTITMRDRCKDCEEYFHGMGIWYQVRRSVIGIVCCKKKGTRSLLYDDVSSSSLG